MKRSKQTITFIAALIGITVAASGCGSNSSTPNTTNGIPGSTVPGYGVGVTSPLPGGGAQVSFQGLNVYNSGILLSGGTVDGTGGGCGQYYCYCGYFSGANSTYGAGGGYPPAQVSSCWKFSNSQHMYSGSGTGQVSVGAFGLPVGYGGSTTYNGISGVEPGSSVTMVSTPTQEPLHANVTGTITLSPAFVYRNFPQGLPTFIAIAFDFGILGAQGNGQGITGGVLLYTSGNAQSGYHGAFLSIQ